MPASEQRDGGPLDTAALEREARVFCRYLVGGEADGYVVDAYRRAHAMGVVEVAASRVFDSRLVAFARRGPLWTWLADVHARAMGGALLRRKLALLLAILENSPGHHRHVARPASRSRAFFLLWALASAAAFLSALVLGSILFLPLRWRSVRSDPRAVHP